MCFEYYIKYVCLLIYLFFNVTASWKDDDAIRRLIYAWEEHKNDFKSGKCKSFEVWKKIAILLQNENSDWIYTGVQCENKFKELRKKFTKVKDHNKQSGNNPMTCKFYNELEDILGNKPSIKPVALASNLRKRSEISHSDSEIENECSQDKYSGKKKKTNTVQNEVGTWFAALREDAKSREVAREQRHKEVIATSTQALTTYKEVMEKLIDKLGKD